MEVDIIALIDSIKNGTWWVPLLFFVFVFIWYRTINYQEDENQIDNSFTRFISGLHYLIYINLRNLFIVDIIFSIILIVTMIILDYTIHPNFDNLPFIIVPACMVIGLMVLLLLLMALLRKK